MMWAVLEADVKGGWVRVCADSGGSMVLVVGVVDVGGSGSVGVGGGQEVGGMQGNGGRSVVLVLLGV